MPDLADRLRELVRFAQAGGAPEAFLHCVEDALVALMLDNTELRQRTDRRHLDLLADVHALAAAVARAERAGLTEPAAIRRARQQFPWGRGAWYRRLRLFRAGRHTRGA